MTARYMLALLCAVVLMGSAQGQESFTDPKAFELAAGILPAQYPIDFDGQIAGTSATRYGMTRITAMGLASDGSTLLSLSPTVLEDFPAHTPTLYMGEPSTESGQFLAGNSDVITFNFDHAVHAFGLYLIGNPSPTGVPEIPFWKLQLETGFEALSATSPLETLDAGSDLYFIGVLSKDPFRAVQLFSDNDPAAVFSFNVDSVVWAADAQGTTVADAKTLSTGMDIAISDLRVTRVHSDRFNVETSDRTFGIAVMGTGAVRGQAVSIFGTTAMTDPDDERVIALAQILSASSSTAPRPLGTRTSFAGGSAQVGWQVGCLGSFGPNNIGLDVTLWGTITAIAPDLSWMTINDGAGDEGVRVVGQVSAASRSLGEFVSVTGSMSLFESGTDHYPMIRVAETADVITLAPAP